MRRSAAVRARGSSLFERSCPMFAVRGVMSLVCSSLLVLACDSAAPKAAEKQAEAGKAGPPADGKADVKADVKADGKAEGPKKRKGQVAKGKAVKLEKGPETVRKAFWAAIQAGRKRTVAKDYAGAIASFDAALVQIPDHPRALSGRGYAKLLADDLSGAEADLRKALAAPGTKKLESAVAFNLGLVAEKRGDAELARAQFSLANTLHASKAAQEKLAGGAACPATIEYDRPESQLYASWMEVWKYLAEGGLFDKAAAPADEAAAKRAVCTSEALDDRTADTFDACAVAGGPWLVKHYYEYGGHELHVIEPADADQIRMTDLGMAGGGRCGCDSAAKIEGGLVTWELTEYAPIDVMEDAKGEIVDCEGDGDCFSVCGDEYDASYIAYAFTPITVSPTTIRGPLVDGKHPFEVKIEGSEAVLSGGGCDKRVPLKNPKG